MSDLCENDVSRRAVLGAAGALFAWSFVPKFAYAAAGARDARFICIVLRGAMDGMSAVAPVGDPDYVGLRESIALSTEGGNPALPLDGFFALHPAMPNLLRLYKAGQATVIHATSTGYRDRSHFDGQDVLESGQPGPGRTETGWMNRLLLTLPEGERIEQHGALGIGPVPPLIVRGRAPVTGWAPAILPKAKEDLAQRLLDLYAVRDPELGVQLRSGLETDRLASRMGGMAGQPGGGASVAMRRVAEGAARLVNADDGPRIAALAFDGWDTHANEGGATGQLAQLLGGLDGAFAAFEAGLKERWADTVLMVVTEFGRTARVNGTVGTDHGNGTVAFLLGGAVKGRRVIADWPGLKPENLFEGRDLRPTTDIRSVAKGVLADLFGISAARLADDVFPDTPDLKPMRDLVV
ncbi:DUF1501 domain-containing protein [Microvirga lotononidis]|uniref:DUF1501 domain-containing protein n=1 Tax=Microvirga lotononidis TaxID=864069 RepID=I4YWR2_9HYPH|nr:DUF1501 domain-containing protein [Microvirga lotononidis]EIM28404.1 hypothetical protein MicloDRAFT_00049870 [Microvirga lotononidis]WQO27512.1 DUF1501 domain-containing protein [Microvirga lotononidis]